MKINLFWNNIDDVWNSAKKPVVHELLDSNDEGTFQKRI